MASSRDGREVEAGAPRGRLVAESSPPSGSSLRIAIVEDDVDTADVLEHVLSREGFGVDVFGRGDTALAALVKSRPALVLLDLNLPGMDGLEVFRRLRRDEGTSDLPVIMLTARTEEVDRIVGLSLGADDYVTKPFNPRELVLRIRSVLRPLLEAPQASLRDEIRVGELSLYPAEHLLSVEGREVLLTPTECKLLRLLMGRADRVQTRDALIEGIWGGGREVEARTLDVHIHRLRRKLGGAAQRLETSPGLGYVFRS
jgi:two-component system phosphate regulon response regulator PhoB